MATEFKIIIDDLDANEAPGMEWTATVLDAEGTPLAVGCGATAIDSVHDALEEWEWSNV